MKGLDSSLSFMMALLVGIVVVVVITTILSGSSSGLENFVSNNINLSFGGS